MLVFGKIERKILHEEEAIFTALINLPFGVYALRSAVKEQWIEVRTAWQLIGSAFVLHIVAIGSVLA